MSSPTRARRPGGPVRAAAVDGREAGWGDGRAAAVFGSTGRSGSHGGDGPAGRRASSSIILGPAAPACKTRLDRARGVGPGAGPVVDALAWVGVEWSTPLIFPFPSQSSPSPMPTTPVPAVRAPRPRRPLIVVALALAVVVGLGVNRVHGQLVAGAERVDAAWAQVEAVLQRRSDLIPRVAAVAEAAASHEEGVVEALAVSAARYDAGGWPERVSAAHEMEGALAAARATIEAYPALSSSAGWDRLRRELVGSENRIAIERRRYNDAVRAQRARLRAFPGRVVGPLFGFDRPPEY
jgi:LemA protein